MSDKKTDHLERIADALDGGGDYHQGTVNEIGYLDRIATYLEDNPISGGGGNTNSIFIVKYSDAELGFTCDKTYAEIQTAISQGIPVIALCTSSYVNNNTLLSIYYKYDSEQDTITFIWYYPTPSLDSGNVDFCVRVVHKSDNTFVPGFWS